MYDVIVVGGGPAGVSAAIYLKRLKLSVGIVMKGMGSLGKTGHIENYYGVPGPVSGADLFQKGLDQARALGIPIYQGEVLGIDNFDGFAVKTTEGTCETTCIAKAVLLATGVNKINLRVKGFDGLVGHGISYCVICDGFFYRDKKIGLVGSGDFMKDELENLANISKDVTIFTNGEKLTVDTGTYPVDSGKLTEIGGIDHLEYVATENGKYPLDALFVAVGTPSATDFAVRMGAFTDHNNIVVDENYMTNIPGLFAAGDCIGGLLQIAKAVDDGAKAGLAINKYLKSLKG